MKEVIKKLLRENLLNEESIQDFISGKGNFLYHGTNVNGEIIITTLFKLNKIFILNKMVLKIK